MYPIISGKHQYGISWEGIHDPAINRRIDSAKALITALEEDVDVHDFWEFLHSKDNPIWGALIRMLGESHGLDIYAHIWKHSAFRHYFIKWEVVESLIRQIQNDRTVVIWLALYDEHLWAFRAFFDAADKIPTLGNEEMELYFAGNNLSSLTKYIARELAILTMGKEDARELSVIFNPLIATRQKLNEFAVMQRLQSITTINNQQGFRALVDSLNNQNMTVRAAMFWALGCIGSEQALSLLHEGLENNENKPIKKNIQEAIKIAKNN